MPHAARAQIPQTVVAPVDDLGLVWSSCLFTVLGMGLVVAMAGHDANPIPAAAPASLSAPAHLAGGGTVVATDALPALAIPPGF